MTDQPIYVVGGGPSTAKFDFDELHGEYVIAVNQSYKLCPSASIILSMDNRWYQKAINCKQFNQHPATKVMVVPVGYPTTYPPSVKTIKGDWGVTNRGPICTKTKVTTGNSSGFAAVCYALALTTGQIRLIGFDMDGSGNWHADYPGNWKPSDAMQGIQRAYFEWMALYHKDRVINLNPDSGIRGFSFAS